MPIIPFDILGNFSLALVYTGLLIMLTIGLNMVYSVMKFSNFAHAEWVTLGMFSSWWILQILSFSFPFDSGTWKLNILGVTFVVDHLINNLFIQALFSFVAVGFIGILGEILVFGRLKRIRASPRSLTVASIGIGLILRNLLAMIFGDYPLAKTIDCPECTNSASLPSFLDLGGFPKIKAILPWLSDFLPNFRQQIYHIAFVEDSSAGSSLFPFLFPILGRQEIRVTGFEVYIVFVSIIMVVLVDYIFKNTRFGIAMRATADSTELAQVSGINTKRIIYYTWFLAAGLTGFGAAFVRANQARFSSYDGFYLLLPIFAVVILGGVGSFRGGIIAAFVIAFTRQTTNIVFTQFQAPGGFEELLEKTIGFTITFSPNYMDGIAFIVLIIVLILRPQGIYGSVEATRERV